MNIFSNYFLFITQICNPDISLEQAVSDFRVFIIKYIYDENDSYTLSECCFYIIDILIAELYSKINQSLQPLSKVDQKRFIEELRDRRLKILTTEVDDGLISCIGILKLYFHDYLEKKQYIEDVQKQIDIYTESFVKEETKRYCKLFSTPDYAFTKVIRQGLEFKISKELGLERYRDIWLSLPERRRFTLIENWRYLIQERILEHIDATSACSTLKLQPLITTRPFVLSAGTFAGGEKIELSGSCEAAIISAARALAICRARKASSLCGRLPMVTQTVMPALVLRRD